MYYLQLCGTIDLQHCAARGQYESNNYFGQEIELFLHWSKSFKGKITKGMVGFHLLPSELQNTALLTAKWNQKSHRYDFKVSMVEQLEMKRRKEEIILENKLENTLEDYINALYLFEQYNSKQSWGVKVLAIENHLVLKSESARFAAVKVHFLGYYKLFISFNIH